MAAGASVIRLNTLRPFRGISLVLRSSMTWPSEVLVGVSRGVSPVTSTVWVTAPTSMVMLMGTLCSTWTMTPSRLKCLKPAFSASMRYEPGFKLTKEYNPSGPVVNVSLASVPSLVSVTVASGTAEPEASETVPEIVPEVDWPDSGEPSSIAARNTQTPKANTTRNRSHDLFIGLSPHKRTIGSLDQCVPVGHTRAVCVRPNDLARWAHSAGTAADRARWIEISRNSATALTYPSRFFPPMRVTVPS